MESDVKQTRLSLLDATNYADLESQSGMGCVVYATTPKDHKPIASTLFLLFYIGTWIFSAICPLFVPLFFLIGAYNEALLLSCVLLLCVILPVPPSSRARNVARYYFSRFFMETSIRFEHSPDPRRDRPTVLCVNPHGIFSLSWTYSYLTDDLQHLYWCFSSLLRLSPFLRVLTQCTGHPSNIRKATIIDHMKNRRSIAMIPGGWHEGSLHNLSCDRLYIRKRQGFVKYALQYGYTITPSYGFGERTSYWNIPGTCSLRFKLNDLGILTVLPFGRWWCPILPRAKMLHTVVGTPIELPHIPNPTRENVNYWHSVYIQEMIQLYNRYKFLFYGSEAHNLELEIW